MRYLIHLLPEEARRADLDDLRTRLAKRIGWNKALDYPTAHITLVYNIQDATNDANPIDVEQLRSALDRFHGHGPIPLSHQQAALYDGRHLLMMIDPSAPLTPLRHSIFEATRFVVAEPHGTNAIRAANIKEQDWPHMTLAQDIHMDQARTAAIYLADHGRQASLPLQATEIALLARNLDAKEAYRICFRVPL